MRQDGFPGGSVPAEPSERPVQLLADACLSGRRASDASDAVRPGAAADGILAQKAAPSAERSAVPELAFQVLVLAGLPAEESALCTQAAGQSAA